MTSYDTNAQVYWKNMVVSVLMLEFQRDFLIFF